MTAAAASRPTVVSYPGVMAHAQQVAQAFHEIGDLQAFVTTFAVHDSDWLMRRLSDATNPLARRLTRELQRRRIDTVPADQIVRYPFWEILRTLASRAQAPAPWVDRLWDCMSHRFDRQVARHHMAGIGRLYGYEYTSLESFERARALGVQTVLDLPSLDNLELKAQLEREYERYPSMRSQDSSYFDRKFPRRHQRRRREIELADVIIANSRLTAQSHIRAGADAARVRVVPLAGPPPVEQPFFPDQDAPLQVLWASGVTPRKGAHYFLEAWQRLRAGDRARAHMYGAVALPPELARIMPGGMEFHGAVDRDALLHAMARADVLVFATLSDGFGMVVSEALAQGLPVITTDRAGAADRIEHGRNGLIVPAGDAGALLRALQWCLDEREALSRMRVEARDSAARWSWSDYRAAIRKACE